MLDELKWNFTFKRVFTLLSIRYDDDMTENWKDFIYVFLCRWVFCLNILKGKTPKTLSDKTFHFHCSLSFVPVKFVTLVWVFSYTKSNTRTFYKPCRVFAEWSGTLLFSSSQWKCGWDIILVYSNLTRNSLNATFLWILDFYPKNVTHEICFTFSLATASRLLQSVSEKKCCCV